MDYSSTPPNTKGISLIEVVISIAVLMVILISVYQAFTAILESTEVSRIKIAATNLSNEQFEIIRNLSYDNVGTINGLPSGKIPQVQTIVRDGFSFTVITTIIEKDDPFDGLFPVDTSPADWKLAELEISCSACQNSVPLHFETRIGPKNLENTSNNGALFIHVFETHDPAVPVQGANIHIVNTQSNPLIDTNLSTDNKGQIQLINVPPGVNAYQLTVTKNGYSSEKTYSPGDPANPNPTVPHVTVVTGQVSPISFSIDTLSTLNLSSTTNTCSPVGNIAFSLKGSKRIGENPIILKYDKNDATDGQGLKSFTNLDADSYTLKVIDTLYNLSGSIPSTAFSLNAGSAQNLKLIVEPKNPSALLVTVKDMASGLALSGVDVEIKKGLYDNTLTTGRGFLRQTDWSGGAGQSAFTDPTKFFDSDGNIEISDPTGEIKLRKIITDYAASGVLTSSTFDTGSASNFYQLLWDPADEPIQAGPDNVRFQIATNNDNATWNFLGPDGTSSSFYTLTKKDINPIHNNDRYFRYKVFLQTQDISFTPNLSDISFTFSSACVPPGQILFNGLVGGTYTITASKNGYQTFSDSNIVISSPWQSLDISLTPS